GVQGDAQGLLDVVERDAYDVVLCHGVLEYVDDPAGGVANTVAALRADGTLSLLAAGLGGAVLARALAGHFTEARTALTDPAGRWGSGDPVPRRFTAEQLSELVGGAGLAVGAVHGVRIFADLVPGVLVDTEPGAVEALLRLEEAAAELPAFHAVATQLHVLGEKRA
ncbi:SAM-dependent methyltransferase, partial [Streptomyces sp. NPDC054840]